MTTYLSTLLTNTSTRYAALKETLLPESAEKDGDTEDDSQICRVLRAYYVEKSRPFPEWLPPDPKQRRPEPAPQQPGYFGGYGSQNGGQASYGSGASGGFFGGPTGTHTQQGVYRPGGPQSSSSSRRTGGLSDLWADSSRSSTTPPPQPQSLRAGRQPPPQSQPLYTTQAHQQPAYATGQAMYTSSQAAYVSSQSQPNYGGGPAPGRGERYSSGGAQSARLTPSGGRPLPSQREGSYQTLRRDASGGSQASSTTGSLYGSNPYDMQPSASAGGGGGAGVGGQTAQDRLKAKLWGSSGRTSGGAGPR